MSSKIDYDQKPRMNETVLSKNSQSDETTLSALISNFLKSVPPANLSYGYKSKNNKKVSR